MTTKIRASLRGFFAKMVSRLTAETILVTEGLVLTHYASLILWPEKSTFRLISEGSIYLGKSALGTLSPMWGVLMFLASALSLFSFFLSLSRERTPYAWMHMAALGNALVYSYVALALAQNKVPFGLYKIHVLHVVFACIAHWLVTARKKNDQDREGQECAVVCYPTADEKVNQSVRDLLRQMSEGQPTPVLSPAVKQR